MDDLPVDDLAERDLTGVPDEDLSDAERAELQRRLDDFLARMQIQRLPAKPAKPKRIMRWDPVAIARRH